MEMVKKLDTKLSELFKDAPALPQSSKEVLAQIWPWLALIGGAIQLFAALAVWRLLQWTNSLTELTTYYARTAGVNVGPSTFDKVAIYLGVAVLVVDAVILLAAFNPLRARQRRGWDLLFLAAIVNVLYSVVAIFINGRGLSSFIFSLLSSAVGFYLLYQVKGLYGDATKAAKPTKAPAAPKAPSAKK